MSEAKTIPEVPDDLPTVTHSKEVDFLGYKLTAHVLSTGQRVFENTPELRRMLSEMAGGPALRSAADAAGGKTK